MSKAHLSFRMGMLISLTILGAAMALGVTRWRSGHRTASRSIEWHGMHIVRDSDLAFDNEGSTLLLRSPSESQFDTTGSLLFRWTATTKVSNFEYEESVCAAKPNCKATTDTIGRVAFDCISFYHGSLEEGDFSSGNRCRVRQAPIEARYGCYNLACDRFRSIALLAFASLNHDGRNDIQNR
jgi:hypothetical protein